MTRSEFALADSSLHVSSIPAVLPCRQVEQDALLEFIVKNIQKHTTQGDCCYVSGVPGTGKTATITELLKKLPELLGSGEEDDDEIPYTVLSLNGMTLPNPRTAYTRLYKHITQKDATHSHAVELLNKLFNKRANRRKTTILILDELDLLVTRNQDILYNFFDWPKRRHSKLVVIAIANTMDLPERLLTAKVASRLGLVRVTFAPYTKEQLIEIIKSRLEGLDVFKEGAVEFCASKVVTVTGDARRALEYCRMALQDCLASGAKRVEIKHVAKVIKSMVADPAVLMMPSLSLHEKIFLCSLLQRVRRQGIGEATFAEIFDQHLYLCRQAQIKEITQADAEEICSELAEVSLIIVENSSRGLIRKLKPNINEEELANILKADPDIKEAKVVVS